MENKRLEALIKKLPQPSAIYASGSMKIEIYRVKDLFNPDWIDKVLAEILMICRRSYRIYGNRPLLDKYDRKSAIYLARVIYPGIFSSGDSGYFLEEWLSVRLVPCSGNPRGSGELDIFHYKGKKVEDWIKEDFAVYGSDYLKHIFSSSRMCGIHPYVAIGEGNRIAEHRPPLKHQHTAFCYALINKHFLEDWLTKSDCQYITGVILDKFIETALTIFVKGKKTGTAFVPACQILGAENSREVRLDRKANRNYAYRFPAYWFDMRQLLNLINRLCEEQKITQETLYHYLGLEMPLQDLLAGNLSSMEIIGKARKLGSLLVARGKIKNSPLTGEELRAVIDREVGDAPELKITPIDVLRESIDEFLNITSTFRLR